MKAKYRNSLAKRNQNRTEKINRRLEPVKPLFKTKEDESKYYNIKSNN